MTRLPKSAPRAGRTVKHVLSDGTTKTYTYDRWARGVRPDEGSTRKLIEAYQQSPEWRALAPVTQSWRTIYLQPLSDAGGKLAANWTRVDIMQIRDAMAEHRGNGAANAFVAAAAALFAWAVDRELITATPATRIKPIAGGSIKAWTDAQADAAERDLSPRLSRVITLARHTGQRRGDLCAMRWSDYDGAVLAFTQQKTGRDLVIPVHPVLKVALDTWQRVGPTILVNHWRKPWPPVALSSALRVALDDAGLPAELSLHGLRKLAAASLADCGCTSAQIGAITGHTTLKEIERYTKSADQKRLAVEAMARMVGRK